MADTGCRLRLSPSSIILNSMTLQHGARAEYGTHGTKQRIHACRHRLRRLRIEQRLSNFGQEHPVAVSSELESTSEMDVEAVESDTAAGDDDLRAS
ncbi:MAG: hypothetical protein QOJ64_4346 [Acidobacteriota bacterium]|jgi:hypothetical protein|nr:hypothetical protein [Acidobacteriota bacterium]